MVRVRATSTIRVSGIRSYNYTSIYVRVIFLLYNKILINININTYLSIYSYLYIHIRIQ